MDFVPAHQRFDPVTAPAVLSRRCRLSVLFCDLCDSTALSGRVEAEEYGDVLASLRALYESVVAQHGGTVVRLQGDGMLAIFGFPQPREGDGRRAVEAALQLHGAAAELHAPGPDGREQQLRLHSGIHAGMVLVQGGDLITGRLELLGVIPNLAARVAGAAESDEILVTEETLGPDRFCFRTGELRVLHAKGHDDPMNCWPVVGRSAGISSFEARIRRGLHPFVGRQDEFLRLDERLGEALAGATRHVAISGSPGLGKTRLAEEFLVRAAWKGCRVLKGYCDSELDAMPLQPLLQMARSALSIAPGASPAEVAEALSRVLGPLGLESFASALLRIVAPSAETAGTMRSAIAEEALQGLSRFFTAMAERQPLVLFIDDWQWSDAATRQALAAICAASEHSALLVLYSTRGMDASDATMLQVDVIHLEPFSKEETKSSIRALLPHVDPFVADDIYRYSGGNALFIEELCHSAGQGKTRLAGYQTGVAWLQVLIESRVSRLSPALAGWLRTLSVMGNLVPAWLLLEVTNLRPDDGVMQALVEKDFIYHDATGSLHFKHGLTRDVIYESVGLRERRELHLRIAHALLRHAAQGHEEPHEALAYHYGAAGCPAESAHHAELAGDRAAAVSALDFAKTLYHSALARLQAAGLEETSIDRWLTIANKLGLICVFDASRKDLPVFERAVALAGRQADTSLQARASYWLGYILYALGQSRDAVAHCERASALAGTGDHPLAVQIRATLGQVKAAVGDYAGALPLLEDAVAIKRAHRRSSRPAVGLAYSLVCLASVVGDRGDFSRAHECFDEAWALLDSSPHEIGASIQGWRAVVSIWQGRWADAAAAAQESTRIAEQTHSLFQFCQGRATAAYAEWMLSGEARSIAILEESTLWLEPRESGLFRSLDHGWLAEGQFARGETAAARRHAALALQRSRAGDLIGVAVAYRALARDAAARHDVERAQRYLAAARHIGVRRESAHEAAVNELCASQIALSADALRLARRHADAALAGFEAMEMHWHAAQARAVLSHA